MALKFWITLGAVLLITEVSARPKDLVSNDSPSVYALGTRRYRATTAFRSLPKNELVRVRQYNSTSKTHRRRILPQSPLLNQMQGKAIFFADPNMKSTPTGQTNFLRKVGQSSRLSEKTVNDTIEEVEAMMKDNPNLPRLSRQEMISIIHNITNNGTTANITGKPNQNESREEYIRSLMLVMPFNTNNLSDSMIQDLYTKPPITEIITTTPATPTTTQQWRIIVGDVSKEPHIIYSKGTTITTPETTFNTTTQTPTLSTSSYTISRGTEKYKNKYSEFGYRQRPKINTVTTQKPSTVIEKFTVPRYRVRTSQKPDITTEETQSVTPKYRRRTTQRPTTVYQYPEIKTTKAPFVVTATSVTAKPFKKIPEEVTIPVPLMGDNTPIRKDVKELLATLGLFPVDQENNTDSVATTNPPALPFTTTAPPPFPTDVKQGADTLSPEMQTLLKSFGLLDNEIPSNKEIDITPVTTQQPIVYDPPPPEPTVDIESYAAFKPLPDPSTLYSESDEKSKYRMGEDMKDFLVSFGLMDSENPKTSEQTQSADDQRPRKVNYQPRGRKYDEIRNSYRRRNRKKGANSTSPMEAQIHADMLPDDMKGLLKTLGLTEDSEANANATLDGSKDTQSTTTPSPEISTSTQATSTTTTAEETTTESIPATTSATRTTKRMDENTMVIEISENKTESELPNTGNTTVGEGNVTTEGHVFNPTDAVPNNEDIEHLNKLLKTVRLLANGTTPEELEYILGGDSRQLTQSSGKENPRKEKMTSLEQAKNPPDPLSFEELVHILDEAKNEVKRQQESNATSSENKNNNATIEEAESSGGPSVEDLAASFGGSDDEEEESELPPPSSKPNGLYFLLDWNSFLEVGEDNSRVNLRFAPKLGDSRNFLPITVP
ncbi:proteoglycan 4 [Ischnura elegans]|uniref:proteoglycan 4 n=1 Tax=Ischnura elegans TaxID=197161 RepID=UPI001ED876B9|nr:proteoglycan 4 [Ischnura elegans]